MKKEMSHYHKEHHSKNKDSQGLGHAGYSAGDMSPKIKDYQKPEKDFSQKGFSKTLDYCERQDKFQAKEAKEIEKQGYMGRYS